jgi:hypothetical protein
MKTCNVVGYFSLYSVWMNIVHNEESQKSENIFNENKLVTKTWVSCRLFWHSFLLKVTVKQQLLPLPSLSRWVTQTPCAYFVP